MNIENWIIVGLALLKMAYYFWPVIILFLAFMWIEGRREEAK